MLIYFKEGMLMTLNNYCKYCRDGDCVRYIDGRISVRILIICLKSRHAILTTDDESQKSILQFAQNANHPEKIISRIKDAFFPHNP